MAQRAYFWLMTTLGLSATDPSRYAWEPVAPGDPDHLPSAQRLSHVAPDRQRHAPLVQSQSQRPACPSSFGRMRSYEMKLLAGRPDRAHL
jgi:hypothetical protein